jgi:hypothetical protein
MPRNLPLQVIPGRRNAVNPEPKNTEFDEDVPTAENAFRPSVVLGSRFRGNDLGGE